MRYTAARISETLVAAHGNPPRFTNASHRSQEPLRAVLDPPIVTKKHRSSLSRNTGQLTQGSAVLLHYFFHAPHYWDIAPR